MIYSYYPGCTNKSTGIDYDISFKAVCSKLDIEIEEVKNWICCGASSAHSSSKLLPIILTIQNLAQIEKANLSEVVVPCVGCYYRFKKSIHETGDDPALLETVSGIIGYQFQNKVKVLNPLEIIDDNVRLLISKRQKKDLSDIRMVCYYGCVLTRPPKIMQFDSCAYPTRMDEVLKIVGINTLKWSHKTECCGVSLSFTRSDIVMRLTNDILEDAQGVGADAIVVACPLCYLNIDTRQQDINKKYGKNYNIPVLYFTQVLGLALGCSPKELGLEKNFMNASSLLGRIIDF
ncbi:MAG: heterodisulfide reductase subunit B [Actinobacteria bacterium]|nr:heterodisulfide reductase subunit B [Actinomycetota bacterium]